jgi:hypothetical protein
VNNHLSPQIIELKKKRPQHNDVWNPGPGLGQVRKCGGLIQLIYNSDLL